MAARVAKTLEASTRLFDEVIVLTMKIVIWILYLLIAK